MQKSREGESARHGRKSAGRTCAGGSPGMVRALRRHWVTAIVTALVAMTAVVATLALVPRSYTATAVVALSPRPDARFSGDLLQLTLPSYISIAESPSVAKSLGGRFQEDPELVKTGISV